jgi:hypothetical protein
MLEREGAFSSIAQIPGPGAYQPEKSMSLYKDKKGFSMALKHN